MNVLFIKQIGKDVLCDNFEVAQKKKGCIVAKSQRFVPVHFYFIEGIGVFPLIKDPKHLFLPKLGACREFVSGLFFLFVKVFYCSTTQVCTSHLKLFVVCLSLSLIFSFFTILFLFSCEFYCNHISSLLWNIVNTFHYIAFYFIMCFWKLNVLTF